MNDARNKVLIESIKRLLRRGATRHLLKIVDKTHTADLSVVFRSLPLPSQHQLFDLIGDPEQKGVLFMQLDEDIFLDLIEGMELDELVKIFENMPTDDVADLLGRLPDEKSDAILEKMKVEGSAEVEDLLRYDDDTAGGIMGPDFFALKEEITAKEAI